MISSRSQARRSARAAARADRIALAMWDDIFMAVIMPTMAYDVNLFLSPGVDNGNGYALGLGL
jgi:hypothetical protein